jgi:hypothetical protein
VLLALFPINKYVIGFVPTTDAAQGLIVGVAVTQEPNDSGQLLPAGDRLEQRLEKKPQLMVADSGYSTRENIEKMARREIDFLGTMRYENVPRGANLPNRLPPSAFQGETERRGEPRQFLKIARQQFRKLTPDPQDLSTSRFFPTFKSNCTVSGVYQAHMDPHECESCDIPLNN